MATPSPDLRRQWLNDGYLVARAVFTPPEIARLLAVSNKVLARFLIADPESGQPGNPNGHSLRKLEHPAYHTDRVADRLALLEALADPRILDVVAAVLGAPPLYRCSTLWYEPATAHQDGNWHRDIQFLQPDEAAQREYLANPPPGNAMQLQFALIPTSDNEFVPGSHLRWDTPAEYHIRLADNQAHNTANDMPGALRLHQQPGDVVAFNADGLHRGRYHTDKPRRTIMMTYTTAESAREDYFTQTPWYLQAGFLDSLSPHATAFYQRYIGRFRHTWQG